MGSAYGDAGDDDLSGSGYLFGGQGNDILHANKSDAYGDNGDDHIIFESFYGIAGYGGNGNDFIEGDTGRDSINLDAGNDLAYGNDGADSIDGGTGSDTINGGKGNDLIVSGAGADKLRGGSGADTFEFGGVSDMGLGGSKDLIFDFRSGSDKLSLMRFSTPLEFIGNAGFNGVAGEVRFDTVSKMVQVDIDGDGDADGMVKIFSNVFDAGDLIF
jgi:Ca2+-binding RTX toxin-like protein